MIEPETVLKVARLARLELSEEESARLAVELGRILGHVDRLEELDVTDVPPVMHGTGGSDVYREDAAGPTLSVRDALANAPDAADGCFRVPKVIDDA
ncbi:MAG: Asp-tRNA(Asn)/Glu-tRNA(Gln) amidotransferase GatCAB subunit C [Planctomycetes bacterium]|nr:Asp-tRNA(Asn)/Glu-tRNA(Gln) amidotransferase GatCAB subunit C [Planctomycetota bacterium]